MRWLGLLVVAATAVFVVVVVSAGGGSQPSEPPPPTTGAAESGSTKSGDVEPERKKVSGPHNKPVPILMYHVITDPSAGGGLPELYVSAANFRAQVKELARRGYNGVTLDEVAGYWESGYELPPKPVVFSFDDGYESQFKNAVPALAAQDWPGVLNLKLDNMRESWGLSARQVRQMIARGWEVDSHTVTHPDVSTLDAAGLEREIAGSRKRLQRLFDAPVNFFCYPSGKYDAAAIAAVKRAGYKGATTVEPGLGRPSEMYTLRRVRVNRSDSASEIAGQLDRP